MGERGPVPKRSDQRRRRNEPSIPITKAPSGQSQRPPAPPGDPNWHPIAASFYASLESSGQSRFYEPSDWALAKLVAESMSRDLSEQVVGVTERDGVLRDVIPLKGASLAAYLKACSVLLVTEGDRRRLQIELESPQAIDPNAERASATITDLRSRLGG